MPLKFPSKILKWSSAHHAHQTINLDWWRNFAKPITRSYNWGEAPHRPVTSWSLTGLFFDAHKWTDEWFDEVIERSLTSGMLLWCTQKENPFSFPTDPYVWDPEAATFNAFQKVALSQDKSRASGVWTKHVNGVVIKNRMNIRVPHP